MDPRQDGRRHAACLLAADEYSDALTIALARSDLEGEARALIGIHGIAARSGRAERAIEPLRRARAIAAQLGNRDLEAIATATLSQAEIGIFDARAAGALVDESKTRNRSGLFTSVLERYGTIDVLILTAWQEELDAVLALGEDGKKGWEETRDLAGLPYYYLRTVTHEGGGMLRIAAAWNGGIGGHSAAVRAQQLLFQLDPACLAVCGICASLSGAAQLGDIIVADRLYRYDIVDRWFLWERERKGKMIRATAIYNLESTWRMNAADLAGSFARMLAQQRPPSVEEQRWWLLHALLVSEEGNGPPPEMHPDRRSACPGWSERIEELIKYRWVAAEGDRIGLTEKGREKVVEDRRRHPHGPPKAPPLQVHLGAIAMANAVSWDPKLLPHMESHAPEPIGVSMVGTASLDELVPRAKKAIVVKAVSCYMETGTSAGVRRGAGDPIRAFACHASASFLLAFLQKYLEPKQPRLVRPELVGNEIQRERFFRGARVMAEFEHPAMVRIVEQTGEDDGWHYFVMEWMAGGEIGELGYA